VHMHTVLHVSLGCRAASRRHRCPIELVSKIIASLKSNTAY
jgi:hypothetical protein